MPGWQPKSSSSLTLGSSHRELEVSSEQIQSEELSVSKKDLGPLNNEVQIGPGLVIREDSCWKCVLLQGVP